VRLVLLVLALVLVALLIAVGRHDQWDALGRSVRAQALMLVPLLAVSVLIAACVEVLVSPAWLQAQLGSESGTRGIWLAWLAGALTPGGGPIGLPVAAALARGGASMPVLLTYVLSLSTLSLIRLPLEWGILGGRLTALRWLACVFVPPIAGLVALWLRR
jgi:uncharacterized membrane protein YraQ (UPF0718 family)